MTKFDAIVADIRSRDNALATINRASSHGNGGYLHGRGVLRDTPANGFASVEEALKHVEGQRTGSAGIIGVLDRSGAVPETRFFPSRVHGKYFISSQLFHGAFDRSAGMSTLMQFGGKLHPSVAAIGSGPDYLITNPAFVAAGTPMSVGTKLKIAGSVGAVVGAALVGAHALRSGRAS